MLHGVVGKRLRGVGAGDIPVDGLGDTGGEYLSRSRSLEIHPAQYDALPTS